LNVGGWKLEVEDCLGLLAVKSYGFVVCGFWFMVEGGCLIGDEEDCWKGSWKLEVGS